MIEFSAKRQRLSSLGEKVLAALQKDPYVPIAYQTAEDQSPAAVLISGDAFRTLVNLADRGQDLSSQPDFADLRRENAELRKEANNWHELADMAWAEVQELRGEVSLDRDVWQKANGIFDAIRRIACIAASESRAVVGVHP